MHKDQIKYYLLAQLEFVLPEIKPRDYTIPYDSGKIISLIGMRRVGKTFLMYQRIHQLLQSGVDKRQIIYCNFDDDRISNIRAEELDLIIQAHGELFPDLIGKPRYYFFDEVQSVPGWEKFCRRLYDSERASIVITGSSSHFLAREVATQLRGRSLPIEVFPLSFREFLGFREVLKRPPLSKSTFSRKEEQLLVSELESYLKIGGLPEVTLAQESVRQLILKEYSDLILYKDILERYKVNNTVAMKEILRYCLSSPATLLNIDRFFNELKSRGLKLAKDTIYSYFEVLQEAFVIYLLPVTERSLQKRAINPKKMHNIDWALGYAYTPAQLIDRGRKLENAVFLHERRRSSELGYVLRPNEIDLVVNLDHPERFINVFWSLSDPDTFQREVNSLSALDLPNTERLLIAHEDAGLKSPKGVQIVPAWKYLLQ